LIIGSQVRALGAPTKLFKTLAIQASREPAAFCSSDVVSLKDRLDVLEAAAAEGCDLRHGRLENFL
jgi:hypothetical protein